MQQERHSCISPARNVGAKAHAMEGTTPHIVQGIAKTAPGIKQISEGQKQGDPQAKAHSAATNAPVNPGQASNSANDIFSANSNVGSIVT
jgi:hypothetical protein